MNTEQRNIDKTRRRFLSIAPLAALAGMFGAVSTVAARFLFSTKLTHEDQVQAAKWLPVAQISELSGSEPVMCRLNVEQKAGWAINNKEEAIFVLPGDQHKVVSAACPHEGCPVLWDRAQGNFLCPCHDSRFSNRGAHLSGPASGDLTPLPAKVEQGVLSVQLDV